MSIRDAVERELRESLPDGWSMEAGKERAWIRASPPITAGC
jgi:hypothetical protein